MAVYLEMVLWAMIKAGGELKKKESVDAKGGPEASNIVAADAVVEKVVKKAGKK